jgi:asparagine synthase (glutamine-hydrolysing)
VAGRLTVFAAILGASDEPSARPDCPPGVELVQLSRHVAFLTSQPAGAIDGEWRGIERLAGRYAIVGRIRLDGRDGLRRRLGLSRDDPAAASDGLLCLQAYATRSEAFLDGLAGDFCFALWDAVHKRLIAARDQLGIRALFHAETDRCRLVSDSLDWIAAQPEVDRTLDEGWIADFLARGRSLDFASTVYRSVRRLPPAHLITMTTERTFVRRYWRLAVAEPLHLRDRRLYGERFRELVAAAVADRLPALGRIGVSMSGGLDSPTLAAFAVAATGDPSGVVAECVHYERLISDDEPRFASAAARHLGIDLRLRAVDDLIYDPHWRAGTVITPEPSLSIVSVRHDRSIMRERATAASVWLYGEGPDNALSFDRNAYLSWLLQRGDWLRLAEALMLYLKNKGLRGWGATARRYAVRRPAAAASVPDWLDPSFAARIHLEERLRDASGTAHAWHPGAIASFADPIWQSVLGERDHEERLAPIGWRHPFLDLRVLEFMLSVPPVPWAREKLLMREAMQGRLPREILRRRKTPLAVSPWMETIRLQGLGEPPSAERLAGYVDLRRLPARPSAETSLDALVAVHALDHWMLYSRKGAARGREQQCLIRAF